MGESTAVDDDVGNEGDAAMDEGYVDAGNCTRKK
jgi:hypothetical protein